MKPNVKVRAGVSNVRDLRADLLSAAYDFREREQDTTLVLPDCRLSPERVADEWRLFAALLPDAASHVRLEDPRVGEAWGGGAGWAKAVDRQAVYALATSVRRAQGLGRFNVQNVLLLNWLDGLGPQTVKSIGAASGTSYPTTAAAIADLEAQLQAARLSAEAQVTLAEASAEAIKRVAAAIGTEDAPMRYMLGEKYIMAMSKLAASDNAKTILIPGDLQETVRSVLGRKV